MSDERVLVIKKSCKNKETQTELSGQVVYCAPRMDATAVAMDSPAYTAMLAPRSLAYYMEREEQLYRLACQMKGMCLEGHSATVIQVAAGAVTEAPQK